MKNFFRNEQGQMSVELCIVFPVVLIFMVIVVDGIMFISACSRFDHVAKQSVLAFGCTQDGNEFRQEVATNDIEDFLNEQKTSEAEQYKVSAKACGALNDLIEYTCYLNYSPWPFNTKTLSIFNVNLSTTLKHKCILVVHPYAPGKL